ncbi:hypothetical protein [Bounagaea algeriensis]
MRRHGMIAALAAALFATAACGQSNDVGFGGPPPAPEPPPTSRPPANPEPKPVEQRSPVRPPRVNAQLPEGYPVQVWTQDRGRVLVATGQEGGCGEVHAQLVEQNDEHVTVKLVEETPEPPAYCTMDLRYPPVAVPLTEPLGERTVVLQQDEVHVPR